MFKIIEGEQRINVPLEDYLLIVPLNAMNCERSFLILLKFWDCIVKLKF